MKYQILHTIISAAEADYTYWNSIQEKSEAIHISRATAFYVKFIETIINGLNAIYSYHYTEEFVGRFLRRKHFFSLREEEFPAFSAQLADEMVASGNSPNGQYDRETIIAKIQEKARRWYYLLDQYDNKSFHKHKENITDIMAYDLTTVFYPSNLDTTLLYSYTNQFDFSHTQDTILLTIGKKIDLDESFLSYLIFSRYMPQNWEKQDVEQNAEMLIHINKIIRHAEQTCPDLKKLSYQGVRKQIQKNYSKHLHFFKTYAKAQQRLEDIFKNVHFTILTDQDIQNLSHTIKQQLSAISDFPSNTFTDDSVQVYVGEKLHAWHQIAHSLSHTKHLHRIDAYTIRHFVIHDILRPFCDRSFDTYLIQLSQTLSYYDKNILLVIAGTALKFSEKLVKYVIFRQAFPYWDAYTDMSVVQGLEPQFHQVIHTIKDTYQRFNKLPRSQYNRLTKAFTSYYTLKKIIELYYDNEYTEEYTNPEERIDQIYHRYLRKGTATDPYDKIKGLIQRAQQNSKLFSEEEFDEIVYFSMKADMAKQEIPLLAEYLDHDKNREKLQSLVFQRYDQFTFKRIMNRNYAGLANLFGTKGFIILIEAYLIGSGIEHVINHIILYGARVLSGSQEYIHSVLPDSFDFSFDAFMNGWNMIDWGRTFLSLFIPILFMMLITFYNYFFYKLNRKQNRQKSFQALKNTTKRWLSGTRHTVSFSRKKSPFFLFELFRIALLIIEVYAILQFLLFLRFEPTQIGLFFFLLSTICLSAYQGNKLKEEVTLGQSEMMTDSIRDMIFIPILEIGRFLNSSAKSVNFIPWLVREGVEPLYKPIVMFLQSFILFQKEKKDELL